MKRIDVMLKNVKENEKENILKRDYVKRIKVVGELDDTGNERTTYFNFLPVNDLGSHPGLKVELDKVKRAFYQRGISNKDHDCHYIHYKRYDDKDHKFFIDIRPFVNDDSEDIKLSSRRLQKHLINIIREDIFPHHDISFYNDFFEDLELFCDVVLEKYYLSRMKGD